MYRISRAQLGHPLRIASSIHMNGNRIFSKHRKLPPRRLFHNSTTLNALTPYLLADIGEGITECRITSWSVKPGDYIQQFDPICEVQSDKASVEITSRFEGTVKALHYEVDDMAAVGSPLVDIETEDIEGLEDVHDGPGDQPMHSTNEATAASEPQSAPNGAKLSDNRLLIPSLAYSPAKTNSQIATPAVRHILKELGLNISNIQGTGKGGRVLKEDVQRHAAAIGIASASYEAPKTVEIGGLQAQDHRIQLSPIQNQMFQTMTRSLSIPHFLYTHNVDVTELAAFRKRVTNDSSLVAHLGANHSTTKLSVLPFVLKALSQAVTEYPVVNSVLDTETDPSRPHLVVKAAHNFGLAVDTPKGLLVPVVRNVQSHSILSIAAEISRLSQLAKEGRLAPDDMTGATLVVSNIGSIGGHIVAPVILPPMTAILAVGQATQVPAFETDVTGHEKIVKKEQVTLSWSADHRVLDGANVARCAQSLELWLQNFEALALMLK